MTETPPATLSTRYQPQQIEPQIYQRWERSGAFTPPASPGRKGPFTIMIPPPNVTGVLHMGHALNHTVQDIVIRFRRMQGYDALWLPGTDHAGIATQAVVEKKLYQEKGVTREQMGREEFLRQVWAWKEQYGNTILMQLRRLGASCDWTRSKFTLDEDMSAAVREAFVRLWEKGLIYRGARLVNWDCALQTAVSDDEIEYVARKGKLWHIRYPVKGKPGEFVTVATTRPETMLGDTGVAVHPADERYRYLVGATVILPLLEREIPLIADETVDPQFGTGAVKVTPGHDPADYERGARHGLQIVNILEKDGRLSKEAGKYAGLAREKAREAVLADLKAAGLLVKEEEHEHNVAVSDRSKTPIEPLVSEQWFVRMRPLAGPAIEAVRTETLRFVPERWTKVYLDWLENVRDWCISRQLWWGHRIPVWYDGDGVPVASRRDLRPGEPHPKTGKPIVRQDEDVLDTWASSWLWPFATLGWPAETADLRRFYPTQLLSTAREIIYLWVARMVMAGYEFLDGMPMERRCPFAVCYINPTVLDAQGRRMSKSLGNGIDPVEMIERYGADAVRFSLMVLTREGQDVKLAENRFELGQRFCNKIWNAARFVLQNLEGEVAPEGGDALEDRWIGARLAATVAEVSAALDAYRFHDAAQALYRFTWNDFCDWYVEAAKRRLRASDPADAAAVRRTLGATLSALLRLLHPFTPFLTEALWEQLPERFGAGAGLCIRAPWPQDAGRADAAAAADFELLQDAVRAFRNVRALLDVPAGQRAAGTLSAENAAAARIAQENAGLIAFLAGLEGVVVGMRLPRPPGTGTDACTGGAVYLPLAEGVEPARLAQSLERKLQRARAGLDSLDQKLANDRFLQHADVETVAAERERRRSLAAEAATLEANLSGLR
ncbi:MAG: valine--tRNA ligase [Planctomycetota bacterium]|nr:MAG: valine--tRNA ligase [Planctomycetota bacterium]